MLSIRARRQLLTSTFSLSAAILTAATLSGAAHAAKPESPPGFGGIPVGPGLFQLSGIDPDLPTDDLAPIRTIVGNARYVGLGEAFHTSGGFYQVKHRLFRYLVEEMGFRVLAMETPWIAAESVNTYVQTCQGTPQAALNGIFSVFRSQETAALAEWMCAWNTEHPTDRVHFYGFDVQRQAKDHGNALITFLGELGFADAHPWISGIRQCDGVVDTFYPFQQLPAARYETCQSTISAIEAYFDEEQNAIQNATSHEALGWARIHLRDAQGVQGLQYERFNDVFTSIGIRDEAMAFTVQAIHDVRFPHLRTAIWAHNGHVIDNSTDALDYVSSGTHLSEALGDKYRKIGVTARTTNVNWPGVGICGPVDFGGEGTLEEALHGLGHGDLIVDMQPRGAFTSFVNPEIEYSASGFYPSSVPGNYDALIYLEESPKMSSLAWPVCQ